MLKGNTKMNDNQNLTTGNVPIKLIVFALPLLAANLLQSFYSLVDMVVVGRIVGENGLAAISSASMISRKSWLFRLDTVALLSRI